MARSRTLTEIADEAYRYADAVGMTDRYPRADVVRWCNKGLAELVDALVAVHGLDWYRDSRTITLTSGVTDYALPSTFHQMVSARVVGGGALLPYSQAQDAELRDSYVQASSGPLYYQLAGASIRFLPTPSSGSVVLEFIPAFTDLADDSTATFDGVNGWEDYASWYAVKRMSIKDSDETKGAMADAEMGKLTRRISMLARQRDAGAPARVRDVRSSQAHAQWRRWR